MVMSYHHVFCEQAVDPQWAVQECLQIRDKCVGIPAPCYSVPYSSFKSDYVSYVFHRDSRLPLIRKFVELIEENKKDFLSIFPQASWGFEFIGMMYVQDASKKFCEPHRDSVFFAGTWHLTVQGYGNIMLYPEKSEPTLLRFKSGTLWFLDSGKVVHQIIPTAQSLERFELVVMWNLAPEIAAHQRERIIDNYTMNVDLPIRETELRKNLFLSLAQKGGVL